MSVVLCFAVDHSTKVPRIASIRNGMFLWHYHKAEDKTGTCSLEASLENSNNSVQKDVAPSTSSQTTALYNICLDIHQVCSYISSFCVSMMFVNNLLKHLRK